MLWDCIESTVSHQLMGVLGREGMRVLLLYAKALRKLRRIKAVIHRYWALWRKRVENVILYVLCFERKHMIQFLSVFLDWFYVCVCDRGRETGLKIEQTDTTEWDRHSDCIQRDTDTSLLHASKKYFTYAHTHSNPNSVIRNITIGAIDRLLY